MFDINSLTVGEMAEVERISGVSLTAMGDATAPKAGLFMALAYVARRREDREFTLDDAKAMTISDIGDILGTGLVAEPDPTQ
jgi:hypothetical protein